MFFACWHAGRCSPKPIAIVDRTIEGSGHFHVAGFAGVDDAANAGYDAEECVITLRAPDAAPEPVAALKKQCETASPVGQTLERAVPRCREFHPDYAFNGASS